MKNPLDWLHLPRGIPGFIAVVGSVYSHLLLYSFVWVKECAFTNKSKRLFQTVEPRDTLVVA
jgi:hypothetical protein